MSNLLVVVVVVVVSVLLILGSKGAFVVDRA